MKKIIKTLTLNLIIACLSLTFSVDSNAANRSKRKAVSKKTLGSKTTTRKVNRKAHASKASRKRRVLSKRRSVAKRRVLSKKRSVAKRRVKKSNKKTEKMNANNLFARENQTEEDADDYSRAPASVSGGAMSAGQKALEIRGQTRNLNMLLVLKNKKEKIEFVHSRENYNGEILNTTPF